MSPLVSVVSVCRNDAWSLTKTIRSVFRQRNKDFEYLVVDGASTDGTAGLIEFWRSHGLITAAISEPDTGVYNAMNKGLRMAQGRYVCFLNAGDVFAHDDVLEHVAERLQVDQLDGLLGWGELNGQVWASWIESEAFKLASLGFCHQSLFVRRELLVAHPFDERPFKTDSDTRQLGELYAAGACIPIVPEVLTIRGGEPGISANLERTQRSIRNTIVEEYPELDDEAADAIIAFRRRCEQPVAILELLARAGPRLGHHLALMVLDTLFLRQSSKLETGLVRRLHDSVRSRAEVAGEAATIDRLLQAQRERRRLMLANAATATELKTSVATFGQQEGQRLEKLRANRTVSGSETATDSRLPPYLVSLTSFPARIATLHFVIQSLVEQSHPPQEIHVWLGADEIPARHWLPKALLAFESRGLKVHFAGRTFHQYDKFMHNSALNSELPFIIVDDDVIYPPDSMASLCAAHSETPAVVVANRCHSMILDETGHPAPYQQWPREVQVKDSSLLAFPTGAGGVLYPPGFFVAPPVTDAHQILAHAPYADDVWLKVCSLAGGIGARSTSLSQGGRWYLRYTPTMRAGALHATNVDLGLNDMQIRRAFNWLDSVRPGWRLELAAEAVV